MKRLSLVMLIVLVLIAVVATAGWSAEQNAPVKVYWTAAGPWLILSVTGDVDLGTITGPDQILEDTDGNDVRIRTNCPSGFVLQVQVIDYNIMLEEENFSWRVAQRCDNPGVTAQEEYVSFPETPNTPMTVATVTCLADMTFGMAYKYFSSVDDGPGNQFITLQYTATTQ